MYPLEPRATAIPPDLAAFLAGVSARIERGDAEAMIESDDLLQCDCAYGGRNDGNGDTWGFTYFPVPGEGHRWEIALTRNELRRIGDASLRQVALYFCSRPGCRSAFPDDTWVCTHPGVIR